MYGCSLQLVRLTGLGALSVEFRSQDATDDAFRILAGHAGGSAIVVMPRLVRMHFADPTVVANAGLHDVH
jgi:hypothetical protein